MSILGKLKHDANETAIFDSALNQYAQNRSVDSVEKLSYIQLHHTGFRIY